MTNPIATTIESQVSRQAFFHPLLRAVRDAVLKEGFGIKLNFLENEKGKPNAQGTVFNALAFIEIYKSPQAPKALSPLRVTITKDYKLKLAAQGAAMPLAHCTIDPAKDHLDPGNAQTIQCVKDQITALVQNAAECNPASITVREQSSKVSIPLEILPGVNPHAGQQPRKIGHFDGLLPKGNPIELQLPVYA